MTDEQPHRPEHPCESPPRFTNDARPRQSFVPRTARARLAAPAVGARWNFARRDSPRSARRDSRIDRLLLIAAAAGAAAIVNAVVARRTERRHPPAGRFVEIDGVRLHYLDKGPRHAAAAPVVLLHGNGATSQDFVLSGLVDLLARERRVIVVDRPGFGYSARPRGTVWTPVAQAGLIGKAPRKIGIARPIVAGHSWGTLVALALAFELPRDVRGLVLLSGYYYPTPRPDVAVFSLPAIPGVGDLLRCTIAPLPGWLMAPAIERKLFAPAPVPPSFSGFAVSLSLRPSRIRASAADTAMMIPAAAHLRRRYHELDLPVAIAAGAGDAIVKIAQSKRLHDELGTSEFASVDKAGHVVRHLEPRAVAAMIGRIERQSTGTGPAGEIQSAGATPRTGEHTATGAKGRRMRGSNRVEGRPPVPPSVRHPMTRSSPTASPRAIRQRTPASPDIRSCIAGHPSARAGIRCLRVPSSRETAPELRPHGRSRASKPRGDGPSVRHSSS